MQSQQSFNEALLKLCILLYQVDGRITLKEQDYFQALAEKVVWQGDEELEDFISSAIYQVRVVIERREQKVFINSLKDALTFDATRALAIARGISHIDGEVADAEQEILDYLENRALAKSLH